MKRDRVFPAIGLALTLGWSGAYAQDASGMKDQDAPGMKELGIDVGKAGTTAEENRQFMNTLPTEQQAKVKEACLVQLVEPVEDHPPLVVAFCKNLEQ